MCQVLISDASVLALERDLEIPAITASGDTEGGERPLSGHVGG